jgi:hypothetical protein
MNKAYKYPSLKFNGRVSKETGSWKESIFLLSHWGADCVEVQMSWALGLSLCLQIWVEVDGMLGLRVKQHFKLREGMHDLFFLPDELESIA